MPRYTDIDKLIAEYDRVHVGPAGGARKLMVEAPIADVVPRAEVERDLHDLLNYIRLNEDISKKCIEENGEENREYFKGKLSAFLQIRGFIDVELKKKYTEGQK